MEIQVHSEYETRDITEAATLCAMGGTMSHIKVTGPRKNMGLFCFKDIDVQSLEDIQFSRCRVEPYAWHMQLKRLNEMVKNVMNVQIKK